MDGVAAVVAQDPPCKREQREPEDDADQGFVMPRRTRSGRVKFPPPISVIGKSGRPWLTLRAHREDGRLVLREMRLPSLELLQCAGRTGGLSCLGTRRPAPAADASLPALDHPLRRRTRERGAV
jgi:hypothetical protein